MAQLDKIRLSGVTYDIIDLTAVHSLEGYATTGDVTASTAALAESIAEQHYQTSGDVESAVSGKVDTTVFTGYTANTATELAKKFEGVAYDSQSKHINFYDNVSATGTVLGYVDATNFIKDGMVSNVEVKEVSGVTSLVISFNTDAGKEDIVIPISEIFDASNYYTKAQTDSIVSGLTSRMAEDEEVTAAALNALNDDVDGKQDTLVSGTNIKTINNQSILGNGNITIESGNSVEVSGTTLVFL